MTTIDIPPHLERQIRDYEHADLSKFGQYGPVGTLKSIAELLPPPAYVPEVGDVVRVFTVKTGVECTLPYYPEVVVAVTDELVITLYRPEACDTSPPACAYRIDAHRFEKVDEQ
jgi:hypothetical protein